MRKSPGNIPKPNLKWTNADWEMYMKIPPAKRAAMFPPAKPLKGKPENPTVRARLVLAIAMGLGIWGVVNAYIDMDHSQGHWDAAEADMQRADDIENQDEGILSGPDRRKVGALLTSAADEWDQCTDAYYQSLHIDLDKMRNVDKIWREAGKATAAGNEPAAKLFLALAQDQLKNIDKTATTQP